jgi:hypothetical protein
MIYADNIICKCSSLAMKDGRDGRVEGWVAVEALERIRQREREGTKGSKWVKTAAS